jgi:hypothetical protein
MRVLGSTLAVAAAAWMVAGCSRSGESSGTGAAPSGALSSSAPPTQVADAGGADAESFASPIPKELIDRTLNPNKLPVYTGPTGSVEGTIFVKGDPSPDAKVDTSLCHAALDTYGKQFREGPPNADGLRPLADAVIIAVGYSGYYLEEKSPAASAKINVNCGYETRTIAMTYGQRLEVTNASSSPFAPRIDGDPSPALMMAPPHQAGDPIRLYPRIPGHMLMVDFMQPYVREDVYILRHPLHAISALDGHYRIDGIPVGKMTIGAQHPTVLSQAQAPVTIEAAVVQKVDLTLEYSIKVQAELEAKARDAGGMQLR